MLALLPTGRSDPLVEPAELPAPEPAPDEALIAVDAFSLLRAIPSPAGRRMLVTGASGGVGHYVTELAAAAGADVTVQSRSPERLLALGATAAVVATEDAEGPFDIVLESIGGDSLGAAFRALKPGGQLVWFGQASRTPARLDFFAHFDQAGATIRHFHYETGPPAEDLATLVRLVATGRLHPVLGYVAGWSRTAAALADLRDRRIRGNAVLTIEEPFT